MLKAFTNDPDAALIPVTLFETTHSLTVRFAPDTLAITPAASSRMSEGFTVGSIEALGSGL